MTHGTLGKDRGISEKNQAVECKMQTGMDSLDEGLGKWFYSLVNINHLMI